MYTLYGTQAVVWSFISKLMRLLDAEPRSTTGRLFPSLSLCNDLGNPVSDGVGADNQVYYFFNYYSCYYYYYYYYYGLII